MANYRESDDLAYLADEVIDENPELQFLHQETLDGSAPCRIAYQFSDEKKKSNGRIIYGDCERITEKHKLFMQYDFLITIYAYYLDEEHMKRLLYHELLHIGWDPETRKCSTVPHDLEDFKACVDRWGVDWIRN